MKKITIIDLNNLQITNNDLFVRKNCKDLDKNAKLIVHEMQVAIFIKDGRLINTLSAGKYNIFSKEDKNIDEIEVILVSKTAKAKSFWGTPNRLKFKGINQDLIYEISANGSFEAQVDNPRKFYLELVGANISFKIDDLKDRVQSKIVNQLELIINELIRNGLDYSDLINKKDIICDKLFIKLDKVLNSEYGIKLYSFNIDIFDIHEKTLQEEMTRTNENEGIKELIKPNIIENYNTSEQNKKVELSKQNDLRLDSYKTIDKLNIKDLIKDENKIEIIEKQLSELNEKNYIDDKINYLKLLENENFENFNYLCKVIAYNSIVEFEKLKNEQQQNSDFENAENEYTTCDCENHLAENYNNIYVVEESKKNNACESTNNEDEKTNKDM